MMTGEGVADTGLDARREGLADSVVKHKLAVQAWERPTLASVQKTRLRDEAQSARADVNAIEAELKKFSDACISEMSPLLVRMLRQLRQLKTEQGPKGEISVFLRQLEDTCNRMHEFLEDLGTMAINSELHSVVGTPQPRLEPVPEVQAQVVPKRIVDVKTVAGKEIKTKPRLFRKRT